jgi:BlaI family transcriptional regulator, penicillinase repressor
VIYALGEASVSAILEQLADPPSYSAVRTMVRLLESKGWLRHRQEGKKYLYRPTHSHEAASRSALRHLLDTFFAGSTTDAVAALLDVDPKLSEVDLERIESLIKQAKKEGK